MTFVRSLPGSVVERQLQDSLSRMFPELLRYSSSSRLLNLVPEHLKNAHRVDTEAPTVLSAGSSTATLDVAELNSATADLWDGWGDGGDMDDNNQSKNAIEDDDDDDFDVTAMGF